MINEPISALTLGLFGLIMTGITTLVPLWLSNRRKTADYEEASKAKQEDWARQDAVAKQAAEAAKLLLDRQELDSLKTAEAARLLLAANERVAKSSGEMNEKLDVIHTLTNSKMTEEMQGRLEETQRSLASLEEIVSLKKAAGSEPSPEALGVIKNTKERITELKARLHDRFEQQKKIDAQTKRGSSDG